MAVVRALLLRAELSGHQVTRPLVHSINYNQETRGEPRVRDTLQDADFDQPYILRTIQLGCRNLVLISFADCRSILIDANRIKPELHLVVDR